MLFADGAVRLAGIAGLLFGWAPAVFWEATPAELAALVRALRGDAIGAPFGAEAAPLASGEAARLMEAFPDG